MKCFLMGVFFVYCSALNAEPNSALFPIDFSATYELYKSGLSVAETKYDLKRSANVSFKSVTNLTGFASFLGDEKVIEKSIFELTQPSSIKLTQYQYEQTGEINKSINSTVNWQQNSIRTIINKQAPIDTAFKQTIWDKHSAFLALMSSVTAEKKSITFAALDKGKIVPYVFTFIGNKEIELDEDEWKQTAIWQRTQKHKKLLFYLDSSDRNIPLKIEEYRNQKLRATLWLKELHWYE